MEILINATASTLGGGLTVLRHLLPAFAAADGGRHRYTVVGRADVRGQIDPGHPRIRFVTSDLGGRFLATRMVWEQVGLPLRALVGRADALFSPSNLAVLLASVPQVLMFQNLAPFSPEVIRRRRDLGRLRFPLLRTLSVVSARAASRVVFISRSQRERILPQLGIPEARTSLVYLGRDAAFSPEARGRIGEARARFGLPERYLLSVSQFYHYKNFVELVHGFAHARRRGLPDDVGLALAGAEHEPTYVAQVRNAVRDEGLADRVRLLGAVPYEALPPLYAGASIFLFPSTCESFPNILIEGLASGAPTLASKLGPMPELAGEGARYFDPFSPTEIGDRIVQLFQDDAGRAELSERGIRRAQRYSWSETASGLLAELEGVVRGG